MIISIYRLSFNQYITLPLTRETRYNCDNFRRKNEINKYMSPQPCRPNLSLVHNKSKHNIQHKLQLLIKTGTTFYKNKTVQGAMEYQPNNTNIRCHYKCVPRHHHHHIRKEIQSLTYVEIYYIMDYIVKDYPPTTQRSLLRIKWLLET